VSDLSTSLPSVTGYDSVGDTEPAGKEAGTTWYDTSVPIGKVYTGIQWVEESAPAGGAGLTLSGGQYDVATGDGLTISSGAVALLLSSYLTIDGNGDLALASGSVGTDRLAFDTATQTELDSHAGDTTNPHNVDDSQTGAASALSNHASDSTAHHTKPNTPTKVDSGQYNWGGTATSVTIKQDSAGYKVRIWNGTSVEKTISIATPSNPQNAWVAWYQNGSSNIEWSVWEM